MGRDKALETFARLSGRSRIGKILFSLVLLGSNLFFGNKSDQEPALVPKRVAAIRESLLRNNPAEQSIPDFSTRNAGDSGSQTRVAQWVNFPNWGNWNNFANWQNWANWANWANFRNF
jgi:hypothetical protein